MWTLKWTRLELRSGLASGHSHALAQQSASAGCRHEQGGRRPTSLRQGPTAGLCCLAPDTRSFDWPSTRSNNSSNHSTSLDASRLVTFAPAK